MKKAQLLNKLKKEFLLLTGLFLGLLVAFIIGFSNEDKISVFRIVGSLFWLYVVPGYLIMCIWIDKIDFIERIIGGTVVAIGITGFLSYFAGLLGLHIKYHSIVIPIVLLISGSIIILNRFRRSE